MDAYDIFKKLTKGLKFKHPILRVKSNNNPQKDFLKKEEVKKQEPEVIKQEPEDFDPPQSDIEPSDNEPESEDQSDDKNQASDGQLQFIEGVKIGEKRIKKKKEKSEDLQKKLELEEQNRFRNEHGIKTVGRHVPSALQDFTDLKSRYNVSQELIDVVMKCGYSEPTPIQRQAMPCMLEDRQILACAPTGSGKTAAFLIPILHALGAPQGGPRALVLCPTRELAQQIFTEALRLSASTQLRCSVVKNIKESKIKEREATIRKSDIVISTPNRLCYLLNRDTVNISLDKVKWLIIDEADKLFEGSADEEGDFRQQLDVIMSACACAGAARRLALFSATHTPPVAKWTRRHLRGLVNVTVGQRNAASHLVEQELLYCGNENGKMIAFRQLVQNGLKPPVLVFVQSKERAKQLFKELIYDGINVDVIHADRTQAQRDNVVRSFRVGRIWVLVCTELMGRGIDFRGVNLVVNYDFPPSAISYVHRVGRAGRAGHKGRAVTFFTQDDVNNLRSIAAVVQQSGCAVPAYTLRLRQDGGRRRERVRRAPRRDQISTVLVKPDKRKLDASKQDTETEKATKIVKTGKHRNNIQNQNGSKSKGQDNSNKNKKLAKNKNGVIKNKNKKIANKKIKNNLKNNVVNKKSKFNKNK